MYRCIQSRAAVEGGYCNTNNLLLSWPAISNATHSRRRCLRYSACRPWRSFSVTPTWGALPAGQANHDYGRILPRSELSFKNPKIGPMLFPRFPLSLWHQNFEDASKALLRICFALKLSPKCSTTNDVTRCSLQFEVTPSIVGTTNAEAQDSAQASSQAMAQLLADFHDREVLSDLHKALEDCRMHMTDVDTWHAKQSFEDAQKEVYNLCVRLGAIPEFKCATVNVQPSFLSRFFKENQLFESWPGGIPVTEVTISVPELDINVSSASSENVLWAGKAACAIFMTEIQQMLRTGTLTAKTTLLSFDTAPDFIQLFERTLRRRVDFQLFHEPLGHSNLRKTRIQMGDNVCAAIIPMALRRSGVRLAKLVVAFRVAKENPDLVTVLAMENTSQRRRTPRYISPIPLQLGPAVRGVLKTVSNTVPAGELKPYTGGISASNDCDGRPFRRSCLVDGPEKDKLNEAMLRRLHEFRTAPEFEDMRQKQASLPTSHQREQILEMIQDARNPFSIVAGATGSGKSTQIPQFLLDDAIMRGVGADCHIICTQPRRIAATSVAARVAAERGEPLGDSVGFQIRHETLRAREHGSITFCTTGLLLNQLKTDAQNLLSYASHILIDEVHERDLTTDFLMATIKKILNQRSTDGLHVPKVVLMSATLDPELFANYFSSLSTRDGLVPAPCISVPGRTFPVETRYIDDIMADLNKHHRDDMKGLIKTDNKLCSYLKHELSVWHDTEETKKTEEENHSTTLRSPPNQAIGNDSADGSLEESFEDSFENPFEVLEETSLQEHYEESLNEGWTAEHQEDCVPIRLVAATVAHICKTTQTGAILVFLPGLKDIQRTEKALVDDNMLKANVYDKSRYCIHILHSSLPREKQMAIFEKTPHGCRNIILSTNIAETSVTVPDVQYVVDAGKLREKRYDQLTRISCLQYVWESKSNARQRAGRAGRVQNGFYYALFSRDRHAQMAAAGKPEVLRSDLQETCLAIAKQQYAEPVDETLAEFIEPPSGVAVIAALQNLKRIHALTRSKHLTPLGSLLADFPVHPRLAKMVLLGVIFRCLDPLIILASAEGVPPLFIAPTKAEDISAANESRQNFQGHSSDHIAVLKAYRELRALDDEFSDGVSKRIAMDLFLNWDSYCAIRKNAKSILDILLDSGLVPHYKRDRKSSNFDYGPGFTDENSQNMELVRGLLVASLYPNLAAGQVGQSFICRDADTVRIHAASENFNMLDKARQLSPSAAHLHRSVPATLIAFSELERLATAGGRGLVARETTVVQPLTTMLFADDKAHFSADASNGVMIRPGGWLPFLVGDEGAATEDGAGGAGTSRMLLDFKWLLDHMLKCAYTDMGVRHRESKSWAFTAPGPVLSAENELLRRAMVEAVLQVLGSGTETPEADTETPDTSTVTPDTGTDSSTSPSTFESW
ncbi:P-loop containing nucleoside triphosphate hydrolase protein [Apiospora kogelbergensis]|uniref:P-loop containing nucleoside triphosphate hydrolase protein n=1 Tax=Apiospora kogelbergensis TaxID=1337665 RepID=UPI00312D5818